MTMQKVKRVFAVLGLIWVIDILCGHIFPGEHPASLLKKQGSSKT